MTRPMLEALSRLSVLCDRDPEVLFRCIVDLVAECYHGSMVMINVAEGERLVFRAVANGLPLMRRVDSLRLADTLCFRCLSARSPLVVQDARVEQRDVAGPLARLGLRRYVGVPILNPSGESTGTLCLLDARADEPVQEADLQFLSMVAMRVSAELDRERSARELADHQVRTVAALEEANTLLAAAAAENRQFVRMVLHDLGHPLAAMKASLYLASRPAATGSRLQEELSTIGHQLDALERLVLSLRLVEQMEQDETALTLEDAAPGSLVAECIGVLRPLAEHYGLTLLCEIDRGLGIRRFDPGKISHLLYNLVSNALRYTPDGVVRVGAGALPENAWWLEVADTGPGVVLDASAASVPDRSGSAARPCGSGLGLVIVKRLCALLGASLEMRSSQGAGTIVRVTFASRCAAGSMSRLAAARERTHVA